MTRNSDSSVLNKDKATNIGKIKISSFEWYVPHYTASILLQAILSGQILSKVPTGPQTAERSVSLKDVNTQSLWTFELGTQEGISVAIWIIVGLHPKERQDSQNLNNDTFNRLPVTSAQCVVGIDKIPDSPTLLKI